MTNYQNVGCAWICDSKNGAQYLRVKIDVALPAGQIINIWPNPNKRGEHQPDYVLKTGNLSSGYGRSMGS